MKIELDILNDDVIKAKEMRVEETDFGVKYSYFNYFT